MVTKQVYSAAEVFLSACHHTTVRIIIMYRFNYGDVYFEANFAGLFNVNEIE